MCWTRLCKVWDIGAYHSICHNFLPTPRGKAKVWIWKHEELICCNSLKGRIVHENIGWSMVIIMHDINKATTNKLWMQQIPFPFIVDN